MVTMLGNTQQPEVLQTVLPNFTCVSVAYSTPHSGITWRARHRMTNIKPVLSCAPSSLCLLNSHTTTLLFSTECMALLPDENTTDNNFHQTTTTFHVPFKLQCIALLKIFFLLVLWCPHLLWSRSLLYNCYLALPLLSSLHVYICHVLATHSEDAPL